MSTGDIQLKIGADTSGAQAAVGALEAKIAKAMDESARATEELSRALVEQEAKARASAQAVYKLSDEEKKYIATSLGTEAALKAKASALGISTAKVREMEAALKKAAPAQEAVTRSTSLMADAASSGAVKVASLSDSAGRAGNSLAKVAGAASMVSPALGELVRGAADVADVFEVGGSYVGTFVTRLAALAPILAIAGASLVAMYQVVDTYAESKREAIRVTEQFAATMQPLDDALTSARAEQALLTQAQGAGKDALKEYLAIADLHTAAEGKVAEATKASRDERDKLTASLKDFANQDGFDARIAKGRIAALDTEIKLAEDKGRELARLSVGSRDLREALEGQAKTETKVVKVTREAVDTLRARNDAMAESMALAKGNAGTFGGAIGGLDSAAQASAAARLTGEEKIQASLRATIAGYEAMRNAALAVSSTTEARETAEQSFLTAKVEAERTAQGEIDEIRKAGAEKEAAAREADLDAARKLAEAKRQIVEEQFASSATLFSSLSQLAEMSAKSREKTDRAAALQSYKTAKALAITGALIDTGVGISKAAASAVFPLNLIPIAAAAATGAVNVATIAATPPPKFHSGTSRVQAQANLAADEVRSTLRKGEAVLNPGAADRAGRQNIDALNAGMNPFRGGGAPYTRAPDGRVFGATIAESLRLDTPLRREIRANSAETPGYRA